MCDSCHVVKVECKARSLSALEKACERLGWRLVRGQKTFKWYGRWVNDYHQEDAAYKQGVDVEDYGKCEHAIQVPGTKLGYEIGVLKDGSLIFDFYDHELKELVGGQDCSKLKQAYQVEATKEVAGQKGYQWTEEILEDGSIQIEVEVETW